METNINTSMEVAPAPAPQALASLQIQTAIPEKQVQAWLNLASYKNSTMEKLRLDALAMQKMVNPLESDHAKIVEGIKAYDKAYKAMQETRLEYTNKLKAVLIDPAMAIEKDAATFEGYTKAKDKEFELRKAASEASAKTNAVNAEKGQYKAFVVNENLRISETYRIALNAVIEGYFKECLEANIETPIMGTLWTRMGEVAAPSYGKYASDLLSRDEKATIFAEVGAVDKNKIFEDCKETAVLTFSNYAAALKNKPAAIAHMEENAGKAAQESAAKVAQETAINTLVITSDVAKVEAPKIKVTMEIETEESEAWAKAVMANFMRLLPELTKHLRIRSWGNLSLSQMAAAIAKYSTETGDLVTGLKYREVQK